METNACDEPMMAVVQSSSADDIFMLLCIVVSFDTMPFCDDVECFPQMFADCEMKDEK